MAQEPVLKSAMAAEQYLSERGEVIIRFTKPNLIRLDQITAYLSIDDFRNDTVIAYANENGFRKFIALNIPYEVLDPPSLRTGIFKSRKNGGANWPDGYPSYGEYVSLMEAFASDYPNLCRLSEFGISLNGRKMLTLKITDNPEIHEREPVVFYSSTMHGDETIGYVLMLRLINNLLENYNSDLQVKHLVDNLELWIVPLVNPDGTYFISDASIAGATRNNGNHVDLNRDFPDIGYSNWENEMRQPETMAMMNLLKDIQPVLSANLHAGAEVVNYPWDTWSHLHADDEWFRKISRAYADTAQYYSVPGYMTYLDNGITNGYAWYEVHGGQQDYTTCILHGREVTIELSNEKIPAESSLNAYWNYNKKSLLQYINQALTGVTGEVTDSIAGFPLKAEVRILNHDYDSSYVLSSEANGVYYRLTSSGNYIFLFTASGYVSKRLQVSVNEDEFANLDVRLSPVKESPVKEMLIYPNPFANSLYIYIAEAGYDLVLEFFDLSGRKVKYISQPILTDGKQEIPISGLASGIYIVNLFYGNQSLKQVIFRNALTKL